MVRGAENGLTLVHVTMAMRQMSAACILEGARCGMYEQMWRDIPGTYILGWSSGEPLELEMQMWTSSAKNLHRSGLGLAVTEQKYKSQSFQLNGCCSGSCQCLAWAPWDPCVFFLSFGAFASYSPRARSSSWEDSPQAAGPTVP